MKKCVSLQLFIIGTMLSFTLSAPSSINEILGQMHGDDPTSEIRAGLDLVNLLPSMALPRKVTEAVVVLKQALNSPNPRLRSAFENAIRRVKHNKNDEHLITKKLHSFLINLKNELSAPESAFPDAFALWMKNQLTIIDLTIEYNSERLAKLMKISGANSIQQVVEMFMERIQSFQMFILRGLDLLKNQPSFKYDFDIVSIRNSMASGKYDRFVAGILLERESDYDENYDVDRSSSYDMSFIECLNELHKRASHEFQPTLIAILREMEAFFKDLGSSQYFDFLQQLGTWNAFSTSSQLLSFQGL